MNIGSILGFVSWIGVALVIGGIALAVSASSQRRPVRPGVLLAIIGVVVAVLFGIVSQGVLIVQPQQVAVVFDVATGNLLNPRGPGVQIIIPVLQEATIYSIAQREYTMSGSTSEGAMLGDDAVVARTADGQEVRIDATIIYSIDPAQVNVVHQRWQERYENGLIRPTVRGAVRDEVARFAVEEVYGTERASLRDGVEAAVAERLAEEGFLVTDFLLRDIQFSEQYAQSVEQKQIAEQDRLRAEQEAERLRVQAAGERDAVIERANGEAESILIRAEAEAQALALINEQISLNPNLIQWRYIETLGDNVQLVILPSSSPFLFDFQSLEGLAPTGEPAAGTAGEAGGEATDGG